MERRTETQCWLAVDDLLELPPFPPREDNPSLDFLVSSVRLHGILAPLLVRKTLEGKQIVCGHRRLLAARDAGLGEVPVLLVELEDAQAIRCYLSENMCRQALSDSSRESALAILKELRDEEPGGVVVGEATDAETRGASLDLGRAERIPAEQPDEHSEPESEHALRGLVAQTEEFFKDVRDRKAVAIQEAERIVERLFALPAGLHPLSPVRLFREKRETWLAQHSLLVASLNAAVATREEAGLGLRGYALAGLLHDVGMVFLDSGLFRESRALSPKQRRELQGHTRIGHALVAAAGKQYAEIALAARDHHERLDGSGYPNGLRGGQLGRLVLTTALMDSYGSMVSPRPFRGAMSPATALERLARASEMGLYDPRLFPELHSLCQAAPALPEHSLQPLAAYRWRAPARKNPAAVEIC